MNKITVFEYDFLIEGPIAERVFHKYDLAYILAQIGSEIDGVAIVEGSLVC
jgi:type III secretory pathway lipoprotein EscJ